MTEKPGRSPVVLTAGGIPKFLAQMGQLKGNRALRVDRPVGAADRIETTGT